MKELLGKRVLAIHVSNPGQHFIRFDTDSGTVYYDLDSDCCSESWFADIINPMAILGRTILGCEEVEMPEIADNRSRQETDKAYGYKLSSDGGICDIIFRNSSNGYYGGGLNSASFTEPRKTGSYGFQDDGGWTWEQITKDWQAGATKED